MKEKKLKMLISKEFSQKTLIDYLLSYKVNKNYINQLINVKKVFLNGSVIKRGNVLVNEGDAVEINIPVKSIIPYKLPVNVLYEDEWIIVVNKPSNILVHSDGEDNETLTNSVNYYLSQNKDVSVAYPVHRLDYETTGIVIFAKNKFSLAYLSVAIEKHEFKKEYVCLCKRKFSKKKGDINLPIGKDRHSSKQIVISTGKDAKSSYEVIRNGDISKVKVIIEHGRKHQIRVHLSHINHPIIGDKIYNEEKTKETLKLHFRKVVFAHPYTRNKMEITCKEAF